VAVGLWLFPAITWWFSGGDCQQREPKQGSVVTKAAPEVASEAGRDGRRRQLRGGILAFSFGLSFPDFFLLNFNMYFLLDYDFFCDSNWSYLV